MTQSLPIDLAAERRRRSTRHNPEPRRMAAFDRRLSSMIDAAVVELESASPDTVDRWRRILRALEAGIPADRGGPER